jgi:hypothetical protein
MEKYNVREAKRSGADNAEPGNPHLRQLFCLERPSIENRGIQGG